MMSQKKIQILPLMKTVSAPVARPEYSLTQLLFDLEVLRGEVLTKDESAEGKREICRRLDEMKSFLLDLEKLKVSQTVPKKSSGKTAHRNFPGFIGNNRTIRKLVEESARWAVTPYPVFITGETGTGKEMFARLIHQISGRENFLPINCGAIPSSLIESELFGHTRGAFTGAHQSRAGKFEEADGGTIFLDEIGELEEYIQVKLLRVIQFGEVQRLGSDKVINVKTRVIAATNKNIKDQIRNGKLREDLYFRLACYELKIPPLRKRRDEIPDLFAHFMRKSATEVNKEIPKLSRRMHSFLNEEYDFPGNIRELENIARRLVVLENETDIMRDLISHNSDNSNKLADKVQGLTKELFRTTLKSQNGSAQKSAAVLGISQSRFYQLCRKFQLKPSEFGCGKRYEYT